MLNNQKDLFYLDNETHYLNNAYMSPNLKAVEIAGIVGIRRKNLPYQIKSEDFFEPVNHLKSTFAKLVQCDSKDKIALVPSVAYGLANAAKNVNVKGKTRIIIPEEQFPSNYYIWERLTREENLSINIISAPEESDNRSKKWNEKIIDAIDEDTAIVACAHVHWADGTLFDLEAFRDRCDQFGSYLIIDGSQSIGALPFSVRKIKPDVLVTAGYKWLFGPYGMGFAYYGEKFDNGVPIEEGWSNRKRSHFFKELVNYQDEYRPHASRYTVGESSNFIMIPMLQTALDQILGWDVENIQKYSKTLIDPYLNAFRDEGCVIENEEGRCNHLLGIRLGEHMDLEKISQTLAENKVHVSLRGNAIRLSTSVYNSKRDLDRFYASIHQPIFA